MLELKSKFVGETITMSFDFRDRMIFGETLSSPSVAITVLSGTDDSPSDMVSGSAAVSGAIVTQHIYRGLPGVCYAVVCTVSDGSGNAYQMQQNLAVLTDTGSYGEGHGFAISGTLSAEWCLLEYHNETLTLSSGYQPYDPPVISSGALPEGLDVNIVGNTVQVDGIPDDTVGVYNFTIQVTDFVGNVVESPQTIEIRDCQTAPPYRAGGTFLEVGYAVGEVKTSDVTAVTWTSRTTGLAGVTTRYCDASPGGFVVCSATSLIDPAYTAFYYSTDRAFSWTKSADEFEGTSWRVIHGDDVYVGVIQRSDSSIYSVVSLDKGATWAYGGEICALAFTSVTRGCYAASKFSIIITTSGLNPGKGIYTSSGGAAWTYEEAGDFYSMGWNGAYLIAQYANSSSFAKTSNMIAFSTFTAPFANNSTTIVGRDNKFLAIGFDSNHKYRTIDNGLNWTDVENFDARYYASAIGGDIILIGPGAGGSNITKKTENYGDTWVTVLTAASRDMCYIPL